MVFLKFDEQRRGWVLEYEKLNVYGKPSGVYRLCDICGKELKPVFFIDTEEGKSYCQTCATRFVRGNLIRPDIVLDKVIEVIEVISKK